MVKSIVNGVITFYPGRHYNKTVDGVNDKVEKYYVFASLTVAMRTIENGTDTLQWLLADHLGSTSVTTTDNGTLNSILKYSAFGEIWASSGVMKTDYLYTGQLSQAEIGLYYYNARWYDPALGRFIQADTIVPGAGNAVAYDRYAYVLNNPINYNDPTGHDYSRGCSTLIDGETCSPNYKKHSSTSQYLENNNQIYPDKVNLQISQSGRILVAQGTYGINYDEEDTISPTIFSANPIHVSISLIDLISRFLNSYVNNNLNLISSESIFYYIDVDWVNIEPNWVDIYHSNMGYFSFNYINITNYSDHTIFVTEINIAASGNNSNQNITIPVYRYLDYSEHTIKTFTDQGDSPLIFDANIYSLITVTINTICYECIKINGEFVAIPFNKEVYFP